MAKKTVVAKIKGIRTKYTKYANQITVNPEAADIAVAFFNGDISSVQAATYFNTTAHGIMYMMTNTLRELVAQGEITLVIKDSQNARH